MLVRVLEHGAAHQIGVESEARGERARGPAREEGHIGADDMGEELILQGDDDALAGVVHHRRLGEGGPAADEEDDDHGEGHPVEGCHIATADGDVDDRLHKIGKAGDSGREDRHEHQGTEDAPALGADIVAHQPLDQMPAVGRDEVGFRGQDSLSVP